MIIQNASALSKKREGTWHPLFGNASEIKSLRPPAVRSVVLMLP
jgi:hypothetical protein